ncbi:MAG: hypothetical protein HC923_03975 [Myxococcales bacterium]|nr:hypothetical protein [Myxococcales bacterium]
MVPGEFERLDISHDEIEAIIVRKSHLRRIDPERLTQILLRHVVGVMGPEETLHVTIREEITITESYED